MDDNLMSDEADGSGSISFPWADGAYTFRLGVREFRILQAKTNAGPLELHRRIASGEWRIDDLGWTIQLALEGGGLDPTEAARLRANYVDPPRPLMKSVEPAAKILLAALLGPEDDPVGKAKAAGDQSFQTESSPSPPSTAPALQ